MGEEVAGAGVIEVGGRGEVKGKVTEVMAAVVEDPLGRRSWKPRRRPLRPLGCCKPQGKQEARPPSTPSTWRPSSRRGALTRGRGRASRARGTHSSPRGREEDTEGGGEDRGEEEEAEVGGSGAGAEEEEVGEDGVEGDGRCIMIWREE